MSAQIVALREPTDRAWFRRNSRSRNYRVRHPVDISEVESLLRLSVPESIFDQLEADNFRFPGDRTWRILVIDVRPGPMIAKILTTLPRERDNVLSEFGASGEALPVVLGQRVVFDSGN